jgi:hypothetical protein
VLLAFLRRTCARAMYYRFGNGNWFWPSLFIRGTNFGGPQMRDSFFFVFVVFIVFAYLLGLSIGMTCGEAQTSTYLFSLR